MRRHTTLLMLCIYITYITQLLERAHNLYYVMLNPRPPSPCQPRSARNGPITPRQRDLRAQLELPQLQTYPVPPNITSEEAEEVRKAKLLEMYREFAIELHTGEGLKVEVFRGV